MPEATETEKIVEKIKKLLAMAGGNSINEAAIAAAKAQELMEKHSIIEAMLAEKSTDPTITQTSIWSGGKVPTWVLQLAMGLGEVNRCKVWYQAGRRSRGYNGYIKAAGTPGSLEKMALLLNWLMRETDRLYSEEKPDHFDRGDGKRWANAFRLGASSTIVLRLKGATAKARREMTAGGPDADDYRRAIEMADIETIMRLDASRQVYLPAQVQTALTRLDNEYKLVLQWVKKNQPLRKGTPRNFKGNYGDGYSRGREAGNRANLQGP